MGKKISLVITNLSSGGAERVLSIVANYLANLNYDVQVIALQDDSIDYLLNEKVKFIYLERKFKKKPLYILERIYKLRKLISNSEVVISFLWFVNIYTIVASLFLNKKIIISERSDPANELNGSRIGKWLRNVIYILPDKIVFQTLEAKEHYSEIIQEKGVIIPNPITPNLPNRYLLDRKKEVVSICRLAPQKNIKMTIDAFSKLIKDYPDYTLVIYGEGQQRRELEIYIEKLLLNNKIFLPGFKPDIHDRIVDSAIYISSSNYEGISNSMLEALAMGIPSVVTDCPVGGARMFIKNNVNGILVPINNVDALYEAMKAIIENEEFTEQLSKNATLIREELSIDIICKKWVELI
jgi:glycosyltransferase involved in cell wall biosynthesis